jgi:polysaccharide biosynthesis/export protein
VFVGSFLSMALTVRGVTDWRGAKFFFLLPLFIFLGVQGSSGQQKDETSQQTNEKIKQLASLAGARPVDTPVGTGDLLHIDVFDVPELSRDVRVSDTGDISYPLIPGKIQAAGQTSYQLEEKLEKLLVENGLVSHPQVSVFLKEQNSQPISVVGAVNHPMIYQVIRPTTLLEVLTAAGGITDDAASELIITRPAPASEAKTGPGSVQDNPAKNEQTITIRLQDLLESGDAVFNIPVYGGDVITVPRAGIVYVMGSGISQPGGYIMQSHGAQITVLKAVALAHGLTGFAKGDAAVIMRANPVTGEKDAIPVHIKQIENRKMDDVALKSNDILYIPDSVGLKVLARGGEAALGITSSVIVYRSVY